MKFMIALSTAPDLETAQALAQSLLEQRLVACVTLLPGQSHYWWQDSIDRAEEVLMVMKTTEDCWQALQSHIRDHHPYDTPELIALPVTGLDTYLNWIAKETQP